MKNIKTELLYGTPVDVLIEAMSKPYQTENFRQATLDVALNKIKGIAIDRKHESVLEHAVFSFNIDGISRLCLQELARHRIASYTVQSSRYTLPTKEEAIEILESIETVIDDIYDVDFSKLDERVHDKFKRFVVYPEEEYGVLSQHISLNVFDLLYVIAEKRDGSSYKNDMLKYIIPENWRTSLTWTINLRSLRNFLKLRLSKQAHFEIRHLANLIYDEIAKTDYEPLIRDLKGNE